MTKIHIQYNRLNQNQERDRGGALGKPLKLHLFEHRQLFSVGISQHLDVRILFTYTFQTLKHVWLHKKHDMNLGGFAKTWGS